MGLRKGIARTATTALGGALFAALALGGCSGSTDSLLDGGISGTGSDTGPNPDGQQDAAVTDEPGAIDERPPATRTFVNTLVAHDGLNPLVRGVNLSSRAVTVDIDGSRALALGPASVDGIASDDARGLAATNTAADRLTVSADTGDATAFARIDIELSAQTLTTLLVRDAPSGVDDAVDGVAVTPLRTVARTDDAGTALVRLVYAAAPADAAARLAELSLRPAGGLAAVRFEPAEEGSIASAYVSVAAGDYALAAEGGTASLPVSLRPAQVVTLVLTDPVDQDTPGLFRRIVDSDLQ